MLLEFRTVRATAPVLLALALWPQSAAGTTAGPLTEINAPSRAGQRAPAISWEPRTNPPGSGFYLIVWEDSRNDDGQPNGPGRDIFAARIRADGTQVDAGGVNILESAARTGDQVQPAVVFAPIAPPVHLIVWSDPRNALPDIFATRLTTDTMTAIESGGFSLITAPFNDIDSFPSVAFGGSNYFVAYQTNARRLGGLLVQGQRIFPDTGLDGGPIRVSQRGLQALNPVVTAVGSSYIYAFESATARIRATRIPDMGTVGSIVTSSVSTSTPAQTAPDIAAIGQDVVIVWQDNRNRDRDIYGSVLDPVTLIPRGPDIPISRAPDIQQGAVISGDSSGGLVVWQDRRNTAATAQLYGTRLSSTGSVRDPEGFEVMTFNTNAFEPAVIKGPGRDYLVAAIRFGFPNRLFYRIIRDEDPSGTMTASGRTVVPADGVATATVGFGIAQGASGFTVVNGTAYDVTLSSSQPTILEPDADPARPGHQAVAVNGIVQVSLRSTARERVAVAVQSVAGNSIGSTTVDFQNVLPTASNIRVLPEMPRSTDDLRISYTYFDVNGDSEMNTEIVWLRNRGTQPAFNDRDTVTATATRRGDVWQAWVRPGDDLGRNPTRAFSSSVTVGNTPPVVINPVLERDIDRTLPTRTGDRVVLRYRYDDADLDTEQPPRIRWTDRGNPVSSLDDETAVENALVEKGQVWRAAITPFDGFEFGQTATTASLVVVNTAPTADAGQPVQGTERRMVSLDGTGSSDPDPQDVLTYTWTQVMGSTVALSNPNSPTPTFTAPSVVNPTFLLFELVVSDGEASSAPDTVSVNILAVTDSDGDGLDDEEEMITGTDPLIGDTDRDQLSDKAEVDARLDPLDKDTDDDGLRDGQEGQACRNTCMADPLGDADGDGLINARDPDADNDGLPDGLELGFALPLAPETLGPIQIAGTDEAAGFYRADQDVGTNTNPIDADSDDDTLSDGMEDQNGNGRVDSGESDPNDPLDPGINCSSDTECPGDLVCVNGTCATATLTCDPLPSTLECCRGGCVPASTPTAAICVAGAERAQCPPDALACRAGTCTSSPTIEPADEGCSCSAQGRSGVGSAFTLLLLGGLLALRRTRRSRLT